MDAETGTSCIAFNSAGGQGVIVREFFLNNDTYELLDQ